MDSTGVEWSTQKTQGRPAAFDFLKYQQGMVCSKQRGWVEQWVSMSPGLNYYVLLSSSTPRSLSFQVWHQSVSCRVTGTGSIRQQLPVCSAEDYASHAAVGCQRSPESKTVHKQPERLGRPPWGLIHSQNRPALLSKNSKVNVDVFSRSFSLFWSIVTNKSHT